MKVYKEVYVAGSILGWDLEDTMLVSDVVNYMLDDGFPPEFDDDNELIVEAFNADEELDRAELACSLYDVIVNGKKFTDTSYPQSLGVMVFGNFKTVFTYSSRVSSLKAVTSGLDKFGSKVKITNLFHKINLGAATLPCYIEDILDTKEDNDD